MGIIMYGRTTVRIFQEQSISFSPSLPRPPLLDELPALPSLHSARPPQQWPLRLGQHPPLQSRRGLCSWPKARVDLPRRRTTTVAVVEGLEERSSHRPSRALASLLVAPAPSEAPQ